MVNCLLCMVKLGFLGPKGSFSEVFARRFDASANRFPLNSISQIFQAVSDGSLDLGVVPIENSLDGLIGSTADSLFKYAGNVTLLGYGILDIQHALGALPGHTNIARILSNETALNQCSEFLDREYAEAKRIATSSTTGAMEAIFNEQMFDTAAIGVPDAFPLYKMKIIASDIANSPSNNTRFLIIGKGIPVDTGKVVTSIILHTQHDYPAFLFPLLSILSEKYQLNLSSLHSRPDGDGKYMFVIDLEGNKNDASVASALAELESSLADCRVIVLGSYGKVSLT